MVAGVCWLLVEYCFDVKAFGVGHEKTQGRRDCRYHPSVQTQLPYLTRNFPGVGGVIKQRIARQGQGRSGGYRVLLAFRDKECTIFVYGFAKSDRDNIDDQELAVVREVSASWLAADAKMLGLALAQGLLIEVQNDD